MTKKRNGKPKIDIDSKSIKVEKNGKIETIPLNNKQVAQNLYGKKFVLRAKNDNQKKLIQTIDKKEITLVSGPAGTGKSYISLAMALQLLINPDNSCQKIYICRPAIELEGESIGFLKGSLTEKMSPYIYPSYYLIDKMIGKQNRKKLVELNIIENLPLSFIKGMTIDSATVILEESQNSTPLQMKTFLTRIGTDTHMIITGDLSQIDRNKKEGCGLADALKKFNDIEEIGIVEFSEKDIVRNPIISKILSKYD